MRELRFNVFGTLVTITGAPGAWQAFHPGTDGKRRPADFVIPHDISEDGLLEYLADLFHEDATPRRPTVHRLP
ncbi:hypothetical protein LQ564_00575 [Massilia sp. G4R7]|uniref:DUF7661 domain-containing protein n=1 Tax=Massilia phyllostachyos TaxID=2898585 RepID=A0ABS8PZ75_9BURK|nr:hypothetical protein [Massilia phyllostachyos]MCD2514804.1 hypothetical protein [Massilia phyllostachyos]